MRLCKRRPNVEQNSQTPDSILLSKRDAQPVQQLCKSLSKVIRKTTQRTQRQQTKVVVVPFLGALVPGSLPLVTDKNEAFVIAKR